MKRVVISLVLCASLIVLLALFIVQENPTKLPLEALGITKYTVLLANETEPDEEDHSGTPYEGRRSTFLTVSRKDLRTIAPDIGRDGDYDDDFLEVGFTDRYSGWPVKGFAVVALTEEGKETAKEWPGKPSASSVDGDGVYFFRDGR